MEWRPGNTNDAPNKRDWDPQGNGGALEAPVPQVFHLGQRLRIQRKQKSKVSDHAPSKSKKSTTDYQGAG